MQQVLADMAVSVSDLKKNPSAIVEQSQGAAVAVLNHNQVMAYLVPRAAYEALLDRLEDVELNAIANARLNDGQPLIKVSLDDL